MNQTAVEFLLATTPDQHQSLLHQLKCCAAVRSVQKTQMATAASSTPPRTPARVFGAPLSSISTWTQGKSGGLWASVNMAMMGYPPRLITSPDWDFRFSYRAPRKGLVRTSTGALYLPQLKHLGLLHMADPSSYAPSDLRIMAAVFRIDPATKSWYASLQLSARPCK